MVVSVEKDLDALLLKFIGEIEKSRGTYERNGAIKLIRTVLYQKAKIKHFEGFEGLQYGEYLQEEKKFYYVPNEEAFKKDITATLYFQECLNLVKVIFKECPGRSSSINSPESILIYFAKIILRDTCSKNYDRIIEKFIHEVECEYLGDYVKIYLLGIKPDGEYSLGDIKNFSKIILREPREIDYEIEFPSSMRPDMMSNPEFNIPANTTAILTFNFDSRNITSDFMSLYREIEVILDLLRLYNTGRIFYTKLTIDSGILDSYSIPIFSHPNIYVRYPMYVFSITDRDKFIRFMGIMEPLLTLIRDKAPDELLYINFAYQMYKEALFQTFDEKIRISFLITALETLFYLKDEPSKQVKKWYTGDKGKMGKSEIVRDRLFSLLDVLNLSDLYVKDNIIKAYEIRDYVYHGFDIPDSYAQNAIIMYKPLLEYCRISLILFLKIKSRKEALLEKIDRYVNDMSDMKSKQDLGLLIGSDIITMFSNSV